MARLAGKVAFITEAVAALAVPRAERFAEEGAKVVIAEIDKERGEAAAQSARALARNSGGDAHFIHCDIRDRGERRGGLRANRGAVWKTDDPFTTTPADPRRRMVRSPTRPEEEFWRVINLDLYGTFLCSRSAFRTSSSPGAARSST